MVIVVIVVIAMLVVGLVVFAWVKISDNDQIRANMLDRSLQKFLSKNSWLPSLPQPALQEYTGLRLGEISRHFDADTTATITGWLTHDLGFHGWGVGVGVGGAGLGLGRLGIGGTSEVNLQASGKTRDDMMGDGFMAVFERDTQAGVDTLRVVVPSVEATREIAQSIFEDLLNRLTEVDKNGKRTVNFVVKKTHGCLRRRIPHLLSFEDEASYVSDRLHSVLRMPPEARPLISVYGEPLSDHALLGAAIRIVGDDRDYPLFPISLFREVPKMIQEIFATRIRSSMRDSIDAGASSPPPSP